ncbi:DUF2378 family protein [Corallococcus sp. RDP092CA]|uniref:DUF2378 family protein n=1 Tax=Corallococcus sp. RDP092CA TaxID=3109369 RepID=UPI0035AFAE2F
MTLPREAPAPLVLEQAVEAMLACVDAQTPGLRETLRFLGLSDEARGKPAYPAQLWPRLIERMARLLNPGLGEARALYLLGERYGASVKASRLGASLHDFARVVGAERMLQRMAHNVQWGHTFLDATVVPRPGGEAWELVIRPRAEFVGQAWLAAEPPRFAQGLLTFAFQDAGAVHARVDVLEHDPVNAATRFLVTL